MCFSSRAILASSSFSLSVGSSFGGLLCLDLFSVGSKKKKIKSPKTTTAAIIPIRIMRDIVHLSTPKFQLNQLFRQEIGRG